MNMLRKEVLELDRNANLPLHHVIESFMNVCHYWLVVGLVHPLGA